MHHPHLVPFVLFLLCLDPENAGAGQEASCDQIRDRTLGELKGFSVENSGVQEACRFNSRAPANRKQFGFFSQGICERTYTEVNGYVQKVKREVESACRALGSSEACPASQSACLRAAASRFSQAARKLSSAREILGQAKSRMGDLRIQNAQVARAYAENLNRIQFALEKHRTLPSPQPESPLDFPRSDLTGADSKRTEGLPSLREVLRTSQLNEDTRAIHARALAIDRAFLPGSKTPPEYLGPYAGEQFQAFRHAGEFSDISSKLKAEIGAITEELETNGRRAELAAKRLERMPAETDRVERTPEEEPERTSAIPLLGGFPSPNNGGATQATRNAPAESRSDIQLGRITSAAKGAALLLNLAAEAGKKDDPEKTAAQPGTPSPSSALSPSGSEEPAPLPMERRPALAEATTEAVIAPLFPSLGKLYHHEEEEAPEALSFSVATAAPPVSHLPGGALSASGAGSSKNRSGPKEELPAALEKAEPSESNFLAEGGAPSSRGLYGTGESLRERLRRRMGANEPRPASETENSDPDDSSGSDETPAERYPETWGEDSSAQEKEMAIALRDLSAAYPGDLFDEISGENSAPLFERVRQAHWRFQQRHVRVAPTH